MALGDGLAFWARFEISRGCLTTLQETRLAIKPLFDRLATARLLWKETERCALVTTTSKIPRVTSTDAKTLMMPTILETPSSRPNTVFTRGENWRVYRTPIPRSVRIRSTTKAAVTCLRRQKTMSTSTTLLQRYTVSKQVMTIFDSESRDTVRTDTAEKKKTTVYGTQRAVCCRSPGLLLL